MKSLSRILLLIGVLFVPALASAQVVYPARPEILGPEEIVFDYSTDACCTEDIPDGPAQAFRDADGKIQLIAIHKIAYRMIGDDFNSLHRDCANGPVFTSDNSDRPETYNNQEWLAGVYTLDGRTIYSIVHNEYKPEGDAGWMYAWYNTLTFAVSVDTGRHYTQPAAPAQFLAGIPYQYAPGSPMGIFGGSKPVYNPADGFYYALVHLERYRLQEWGVGVIRTRTLDDPDSWRGWDGTGFNVHFVDPYNETVDDPANHILAPVSRNRIGKMCESLTFSTYFNEFMVVGFHVKYDASLGRNVYGFYYALSHDLIHWSEPILVYESPTNGWQQGGIYYPAIIDHSDTSRNFERPDQEAYLYFTKWNSGAYDRDLVRVPIRFKKNVVTGFTVNSTEDREAKNVGDGTAYTGFTNSVGEPELTLRSALREINASPDSEFVFTVRFNIPGEGVHTIHLSKFLPDLLHPAVLDGFSQPGASANSLPFDQGNNAKIRIELDGSGTGGALAFTLAGGNSHLKGLALFNFGGGVEISGDGENTIEGCFIGLDASGQPQGNSLGITIHNSARNTIGGESPASQNVITGQVTVEGSQARENQILGNYIGTDATGAKTVGPGTLVLQDGARSNVVGKKGAPNLLSGSYHGLEIQGAETDSNLVVANLLGVDKTGTVPLHSGLLGIFISDGAQYNEIGRPGEGNVIGSWEEQGLVLTGAGTEFNRIRGNWIGTDTTGAKTFGNGSPAVEIRDQAAQNQIGGTGPGEGNVVAHNPGTAVGLRENAGNGNAIVGNAIYANGFGIDLFPAGVTENDSLDADSGPNSYQNFPVLWAAKSDSGRTCILGMLESRPNATFRVEFFDNKAAKWLDFGQGEKLIGFQTVMTNSEGRVKIDAVFPQSMQAGHFVTATATDDQNNTSEFSNAIQVADGQMFPEAHIQPETLTFSLRPQQMLDDSIVITNSGSQTLGWQAEPSVSWMRLSAQRDTTAAGGRSKLVITVDPAGLPFGLNTGYVVIYTSDVNHPADTVWVQMTITGETRLDVSPDAFSWNLHAGENGLDTLEISNTGEMSFTYRLHTGASWLEFSPDSGALQAGQRDTVFLTVHSQGLQAGFFSDWLQIELVDSEHPPIQLKVELTVESAGTANFSVEPDSLVEMLPVGGRLLRKLTVQNSGSADLKWSGSISELWARIMPDSGKVAPAALDSVFVEMNAAGLVPGDYQAHLVFRTNDPSRAEVNLPIFLRVLENEANVVVWPDSFEITLPPEAMGQDTLRIENHSKETVGWKIETKEPWIHMSADSGELASKSVQEIQVNFDTRDKPPGDYFGGMVIHFLGSANPDHFVPVHVRVEGAPTAPRIFVFPDHVTTWAGPGEKMQDTVFVANQGNTQLEWQLFSKKPWLRKSVQKGTTPPGDTSLVILTLDTNGLNGDHDTDTLLVQSNDPMKAVVAVPVEIYITLSVARQEKENQPKDFYLFQNSPNPFNPVTTIWYELPLAGEVEVRIIDFRGRQVNRLFEGRASAGRHGLRWRGVNERQQALPSGIYFVQLRVHSSRGLFRQVRKMILLH